MLTLNNKTAQYITQQAKERSIPIDTIQEILADIPQPAEWIAFRKDYPAEEDFPIIIHNVESWLTDINPTRIYTSIDFFLDETEDENLSSFVWKTIDDFPTMDNLL